jgi:hypothetical protein
MAPLVPFRRSLAFASLLGLAACATLAESASTSSNLPNSDAGPFRATVAGEIGQPAAAPNAVDDDLSYSRDPSVVDLDGDPSTLAVAGFFSCDGPPGYMVPSPGDPSVAIVRYDAADGRSFQRPATLVLSASEPWEGGTMGQPSVLLVGGVFWMYYAAAGGIGLARSPDGLVFTRVPGPVLGPAPGGTWEGAAVPASPGVVQLPDGSFRMFYEVPLDLDISAIGEAGSPDGLTWTRLGDAPALAPSPPVPCDLPFDGASVGAPFAMMATSAEGREEMRLYYGGRDVNGVRQIGLAARFGTDGPFQRAISSVYGSNGSLNPTEPCVLAYPGFSLLFVTELEGDSSSGDYPAVAVGVAPATASLPPPNPP